MAVIMEAETMAEFIWPRRRSQTKAEMMAVQKLGRSGGRRPFALVG
jgi:hypothetical protein